MRNIPTPVGKTKVQSFLARELQKHPHARGEDSLAFRIHFDIEETSPRPWGRRLRYAFQLQKLRNIPTPVGKTSP